MISIARARILASKDELSTDEDWSDDGEEEADLDEMSRNVEALITNKKTAAQIAFEKEEQERQEMQRLLKSEQSEQQKQAAAEDKRLLKITRRFESENGRQYIRNEFVRSRLVIDLYVKIKQQKQLSEMYTASSVVHMH